VETLLLKERLSNFRPFLKGLSTSAGPLASSKTKTSRSNISRTRNLPGDVVILRMMGPIGGPGTAFVCSFMAAAVGAGLAESIAVVTDGELSGLNRGITIGQVMPEPAAGGPLAVVREGERISIDFRSRTIQLEIDATELKARMEAWRPPARDLKAGWLAIYSQLVQPLSKAQFSARGSCEANQR
jgi:dihydroxyacid dehydratase/phosphogluconate dehydratase